MALDFPAAASAVVPSFTRASQLIVKWVGATTSEGCQMAPREVVDVPELEFQTEPGKLYTIILSDPDAPNPSEPKFAEWIHWLVVNVPGSDVSAGIALVPYFGSAPGNGAGNHRYMFVVYEQSGEVSAEESRVAPRTGFPPRRSFNSTAFAEKHGLRPIAVLSYKAEWDDSVPESVKKLMPEAA